MKGITRIYLFIIFLAAAFLLFYNLDNQYLWQDEAETASLAKNTLKFGLPKAYDEKNIILLADSSNNPTNYLPGYLWRGQPWFAIYVTALSFKIFGINTFAARFPFALIGLLSIFLTYLLARRLFNNTVSNIAIFIITFSVPFILHSRQCRYYSPGIFLTMLCIYLYLNYAERKKFSGACLTAALFFLLNTSISYFISVISGILIHLYLIERRSFLNKRNILLFLGIFLYAVPIMYLMKLSRRAAFELHWIFHNIKYYIRGINAYIFPWRGFAILYLLYVVKKRRWRPLISDIEKRAVLMLIIFIAIALPYLIFLDCNSLRYVIHVAPLFYILEAYIFYKLIKWRKTFAFTLIAFAIFTNILSISLPIRSYFFNYIYEITHDYDGPVEGIVKFLKANAKAGDSVKITYGDNACIFYTDLKVNNMPPFNDGTYPEWVIPREHWNKKEFYESDYGKEIKKRYEEITIPYPDIPWENRPDDMGYHKFKTDTSAPRIKIYKRHEYYAVVS